MQNIIQRLISGVFKVLLVAFGMVFAISLLLAALIVIVFSLLKSLVTGKKPAPLVVLRRFQQFAPSNVWPGTSRAQDANDVVDVDVSELRDVQPDRQQLKSEKL